MENAGVDPTAIPKSMTDGQYEWWVLFGICVAGKGAKQTEKKLNALLSAGVGCRWEDECVNSPFARIRFYIKYKQLGWRLRRIKMGQYKRINKAFRAVVKRTARELMQIDTLERIPGIGPKTARMLVLYSDPNADCVPLDTHILKYLKAQGVPNVPKSTPAAGPTYKRLEAAFQDLALSQRKTVRELDTEAWKSYAKI